MRRLLYFLILISFESLSQTHFYNVFKGDGQKILPQLGSVLNTRDGGFLVDFTYNDTVMNAGLPQLAKFNACNEFEWHKEIDLHNVIFPEVYGDTIIVLGYVLQKNNSISNNRIALLNSKGDALKTVEITDSYQIDDFYGTDLKTFPNGDVLLSGTITFPPFHPQYGHSGTIVVRLDRNLNVLWANSINTTLYYPVWIMALTSGRSIVYNPNSKLIFCFNQDGSVAWVKQHNADHGQWAKPIEVGDGLVFSAKLDNDGPNFIFKLDFNGSVVWSSETVEKGYLYESLIWNKNDNTIIYVNNPRENNNWKQKIRINEFNDNGRLESVWQWKPGVSDWSYAFRSDRSINNTMFLYGLEGDSNNYVWATVHQFNNLDNDNLCFFEPSSTPSLNTFTETKDVVFDKIYPIDLISKELAPIETKVSSVDHSSYCESYKNFDVEITGDSIACFGDSIYISSENPHAFYEWSTGERSNGIWVKEPGKYWMKGGFNCFNKTDSIEVDFYPLTTLDFDVNPRKGDVTRPFVFTNYTENSDSLSWDLNGQVISGDSTFSYFIDKNGKHKVSLTVADIYGCIYSDTLTLTVDLVFYYIPNSFTPNNDGINEGFAPVGFGIKSFEIVVYNRWGEIVFNERNKPWIGSKNPQGKYVYDISITDEREKTTKHKGSVYLMK